MNPDPRRIRVVIVDDQQLQQLVLAGFRALLDGEEHLEVVAEAATGDAAVAAVDATRPDAVLMDIRMPGTNGIEATSASARWSIHPRC